MLPCTRANTHSVNMGSHKGIIRLPKVPEVLAMVRAAPAPRSCRATSRPAALNILLQRGPSRQVSLTIAVDRNDSLHLSQVRRVEVLQAELSVQDPARTSTRGSMYTDRSFQNALP